MARQLYVHGQQVALLAVIDTDAPDHRQSQSLVRRLRVVSYFLRNLPLWITNDLLRADADEMLDRLRRNLKANVKKIAGGMGVYKNGTAPAVEDFFRADALPDALREIMQKNLQAQLNYLPQPYPSPLALFRARVRPLFHSLEPDLGWGKLVHGGVKIKTVPGDHLSILREPLVQTLAQDLQAALDESSNLPAK
jgi:aspartate racemase